MLQIAVCDDEQYILELIVGRLRSIVKQSVNYKCFQTTQPEELLQFSKTTYIDILLIDIEMPNISGFEVVKQMWLYSEGTLVIFITNMDLYVYDSLKYHPFRFIRKSHFEELEEALISAISLINSKIEKFYIRINAALSIKVKIEDIVYFESIHNHVKLVTINGEKKYRSTLKDIERELKGKGFVRIHSGYLLNIKYVYFIEVAEVEVTYEKSKIRLPVSRSRRDNLILEYKKSLR